MHATDQHEFAVADERKNRRLFNDNFTTPIVSMRLNRKYAFGQPVAWVISTCQLADTRPSGMHDGASFYLEVEHDFSVDPDRVRFYHNVDGEAVEVLTQAEYDAQVEELESYVEDPREREQALDRFTAEHDLSRHVSWSHVVRHELVETWRTLNRVCDFQIATHL